MKLFTIGPVQMYERTLNEKAKQVPYFRNDVFSALMLETDKFLKRALGTNSDTECIYLTASGTAAMEAAVINIFSPADKLLIIVGGTFGKRFSQICSIHNIPHTDIVLKSNEELTEGMLMQYDGCGYTGLLVNHDETSTGQLYDIQMIGKFCKKNKLIFLVDAITSFLCDSYKMDEYGIDATILSSQKGLCISPGISIVAVNRKVFLERVMVNTPNTLYFDFKAYAENMKRGQTPYTPAIGILYEMHDFLLYLNEKGIDKHLDQIRRRAEYFRQRIPSVGGRLPDYPLSNAITPVIFDKPIARTLFRRLSDEYGFVVNPTGGDMEDYQIRVSHIGNLCFEDYDDLLLAMKKIIF